MTDYSPLDLRILRNAINEKLLDETLSAITRLGAEAINAVDAIGQTPLLALTRQWDAGNDKALVLSALLRAGADVNIPNRLGQTPLYWVARAGDDESISVLLGHGASVDTRTSTGDTPLMIAVLLRNEDAVRQLLKAGADPLLENAIGKSAASMSEYCGDAAIQNWILAAVAHDRWRIRINDDSLALAA